MKKCFRFCCTVMRCASFAMVREGAPPAVAPAVAAFAPSDAEYTASFDALLPVTLGVRCMVERDMFVSSPLGGVSCDCECESEKDAEEAEEKRPPGLENDPVAPPNPVDRDAPVRSNSSSSMSVCISDNFKSARSTA